MKVSIVIDASGQTQTIMQHAPGESRTGPVGEYILQPGEQLHEIEFPAEFSKYSLLELHTKTRLDLKGGKPLLVKAAKA